MRIHVRPDAAHRYMRRTYKHARPDCSMLHRPEWLDILRKVENRWLEVDTTHLFDDQFSTFPVPGVSELGLRIMLADIDAIEDDVRHGVVKCDWCAGYDRDRDGKCDKCGRNDHLTEMKPRSPK